MEGTEAAAFYTQRENGTRGASLHVAPVERIRVHLMHPGCCKGKGAAKPQACHGSELNEDRSVESHTSALLILQSFARWKTGRHSVVTAGAGNSPKCGELDVRSPFAEVLQEFVFARLSQNRLSEKAVKSKSNKKLRQTQHPAGSHRRPRSGCVTPAARCLGKAKPRRAGLPRPLGEAAQTDPETSARRKSNFIQITHET